MGSQKDHESADAGGRVYSYVRFSTAEQAFGDSQRRQVAAAKSWAAARGLAFDEELVDQGVSSYRGANLSPEAALGSFVRAAEGELIPAGSTLVVESLDRLTRDRIMEATTLLMRLLMSGVTVVTLADGREYSRESVNQNPMELLASLLVFMRANEESEVKASRLRAVWEAKRAAAVGGMRMTRTAPAWLTPEADGFAIIQDRADTLRRIFARTLEGEGQHAIAKELTAAGESTWEGAKYWHRTYVRKLLTNPAVLGTLTPHVTERLAGGRRARRPLLPIRGYYPQVIDDETWGRVQALLGTRDAPRAARGRHAGGPVRSLLARLARCPVCGSTMTRVYKGKGGGRPRLVCVLARAGGDCVYHSIPQAEIEEPIFTQAAALVTEAPPASGRESEARREVVQLASELDAIEDELTAYDRRTRALSREQRGERAGLYRQKVMLNDELETARQRLTDSGSAVVRARLSRLAGALDAGPADDLSEANRALAEAVTHVVVDYPEGVLRFHWRHGGESNLTYRIDW